MEKRLEALKERLLALVEAEINSGLQNVDAKELGEAVDMIKDLAETCYYVKVTEAMDEKGEDERYGYNNRRYMSGEYAPKGRGHISGYNKVMEQYPYMDGYLNDPDFEHNMRMGYTMPRMNNRYGQSYNNYLTSRRHYHENNTMSDKENMMIHANEHVSDTIATMRDIWKEADTELKKRMKTDLTNLLNEMTI